MSVINDPLLSTYVTAHLTLMSTHRSCVLKHAFHSLLVCLFRGAVSEPSNLRLSRRGEQNKKLLEELIT
jgi:hypothetical protein